MPKVIEKNITEKKIFLKKIITSHFAETFWLIDSSRSCTKDIAAAAVKSLQSCPTLCDPIDGSPPGSPVPKILQARTVEWVAISPMHESKK